MEKRRLEIIGISYSQSQSGAYALILGEADGKRRLPIIIGVYEAQAIAIELEKMKPARPLTHDLFRSFAETFGINLTEVFIDKFVEGVFYAKLIASDGTKEKVIDARTSDAVALAIRFNCPIFTTDKVLTVAGMVKDEEDELNEEPLDSENETEDQISEASRDSTDAEYASNTFAELEQLLEEAIRNEDYERASHIRDEIKKRETNTDNQ
ncbi:MAG: bifunctional nuclease family protein [Bacteroidota bacterium]